MADKSRARVNAADLHKLYSEHIFRKPIRKTHTRRNVEKRKRLNFCGMKDEMTTNKLEYYVPESVRMLRILHRMEKKEEKEKKHSKIEKCEWWWGGGG